jgi:L-fuconolactonase
MWSSDWPVVNLAGDCGYWRAATDTLLAGLSAEDRDAILGSVAVNFYGLTRH